MNKGNTAIIVLLIVIACILGYMAFKPTNVGAPSTATTQNGMPTEQGTNQMPSGNSSGIETINPGSGTNTTPPVSNPNTVTETAWGTTFTKADNWNVTGNTSSKVTLTETSGEGAGDVITLTYVSGTTVTDTDSKFGSVSYWYDAKNAQWMRSMPDEASGANVTSVFSPSFNPSGVPEFPGVGRWKTVILALSPTTFVKANITGSGQSQALVDLLATFKKM